MTLEPDSLHEWLGRSQQVEDQLTLAPLRAMTALLDKDPRQADQYASLPPLWHWLYFQSPSRQSELAPDGHPRKGDFLPPVALPRRMWAGGRLTFHREIPVAAALSRRSTVTAIDVKQGRSGELAFVTVRHDIWTAGALAIAEEHDIVYRHRPANHDTGNAGSPPGMAPSRSDFSRQHVADAVMLFRYSALTFNAHRIHYDREYATGEEGYPGLVVHGPLLATLLVELLRDNRPEAHLESFSFRALRPVFESQPFYSCGKFIEPDRCELWIADQQNRLCMKATALLRNA